MPSDTRSAEISKEHVKQLSRLIGLEFWRIYAGSFEVDSRDGILRSFWVGIPASERNILVIKNENYFVTQNVLLNYFDITVTEELWKPETPQEQPWSFLRVAHKDGASPPILSSIEIYRETSEDENMLGDRDSVTYDKALLFCADNDLRICVRLEDTIAARFEILINSDQINTGLSGLSKRHTIA